ncbi:MAG: Na+/H+ antiporter NhaC family protein [Lachnospiraceae bacterium]|nr:Na+/H+ antiporter NhaC family protein [Lachnospiraceae bacterium]
MFTDSIWALLPPLVAILLALITKEVYSSLMIGIIAGGLLYAGFNPVLAMEHIFTEGMISQLSDSWNVGILIFLVVLGSIVMLMNRAGGSAAFGRWASAHVKTRMGAQLATFALGVLIFIDDYFNCLTVGSVMRPVTDKNKISREKLAYLIDATAAPVCIIAPISSWAAAVTGFVDGTNGLTLFIRAIPYNLYAFLTIGMMLMLILSGYDFGPMKKAEKNLPKEKMPDESLVESGMTGAEEQPTPPVSEKGKVIHLVLPIITLIFCCVIGMIYTGGFFEGVNFVDAFANSDASVGLVYGSMAALFITVIFYLLTGVLSFKECMNAIPEGFKSMVPAILILTLAWTLKSMTDSLGAATYVASVVENIAGNGMVMSFLPAFVFLIGAFLAFATGTSWGTFGLLIPIVVFTFSGDINNELMIIAISACMAGSVCGDHCSPISDTTIMASAGAQCEHINHVSTQLPYALTAAAVSFVGYVIAGFVRNWIISLGASLLILAAAIFILKKLGSRKKQEG